MEKIGYVVKNGFFEYMDQHHDFFDHLSVLSQEQLDHIFDTPDENELCDRAIQFFHNEEIYLDNHTVYYENKLKQTTYAMRIDSHQIHLTSQEGNPFIPFLQRIYRNLVLILKKEGM